MSDTASLETDATDDPFGLSPDDWTFMYEDAECRLRNALDEGNWNRDDWANEQWMASFGVEAAVEFLSTRAPAADVITAEQRAAIGRAADELRNAEADYIDEWVRFKQSDAMFTDERARQQGRERYRHHYPEYDADLAILARLAAGGDGR